MRRGLKKGISMIILANITSTCIEKVHKNWFYCHTLITNMKNISKVNKDRWPSSIPVTNNSILVLWPLSIQCNSSTL